MEAGPPTCCYFATKQVHDDLITKEHKEQWLGIYSNVPCVLGYFLDKTKCYIVENIIFSCNDSWELHFCSHR